MSFSEGIGSVPQNIADSIAGHPVRTDVLNRASERLRPTLSEELSEAQQIVELYNIKRTADRIEDHFKSFGIPLPAIYALHTAGFPLPFDEEHTLTIFHSDRIHSEKSDPYSNGAYGLPPFELFARPDIPGHAGQVTVGHTDAGIYMSFQGRAHPYEWKNDPAGELIVARMLNVIKELIRRQREQGENPVILLSFLAGVYEQSPLAPGDIGIIVDDTEKGMPLHPGMDHRGILDTYLGSRFQPKLGRCATAELAGHFMKTAESLGIPTGAVSIIGTQTTTEYQSLQEIGEAVNGFETAKRLGLLEITQSVMPDRTAPEAGRTIYEYTKRDPSLCFGMGNTFELAVLRQVLSKTADGDTFQESDFPVLPLVLVTDSVGKESRLADHAAIVGAAFATQERNRVLLKEFIASLGSVDLPKPNIPPGGHMQFSLQSSLGAIQE